MKIKMPMYTFSRKTDGELVTRRLSFSEYDAVKSGAKELTDETGAVLELVFNPGSIGFVLKDGASGGWMTKVNKETQYRVHRRSTMARRERDHVFKTKIVPNYQGQEAHSWSDVQDHVRTTKGEVAASTYDSHVLKERA